MTICPHCQSSAPSAELISTDPTCGTTVATGGRCCGEDPMATAAVRNHRHIFIIPDI